MVKINDDYNLIIKMLLDQQQFSDPEGKAARLGICSASWPLFGMLWPSSVQLSRKLLKRPIEKGQKILEIGCGLGLASLTAQSLGYDITASDVLYEPNNANEVATFIEKFAEETCTIWLIDPNRGYHNHFTRAIEAYGFQLNENLSLQNTINGEIYRGKLLVYVRY